MERKIESPTTIVGIDPDVDASGVGVIDLTTKEVSKLQLPMPELIEFLQSIKASAMIFIEAGWMNHGNYHLMNKGQFHASKIGEQIGRNHEVSRLLGEFCSYHKIQFVHVKPLVKRWKGKDGKITHEELMSLIEGSGLKIAKCRTNQETRDAILLAITHSNIPMRMTRKPSKHKEK